MFLKGLFTYLFYAYECFACVYLGVPRKESDSLEQNHCEPPCRFWELNLNPLQRVTSLAHSLKF